MLRRRIEFLKRCFKYGSVACLLTAIFTAFQVLFLNPYLLAFLKDVLVIFLYTIFLYSIFSAPLIFLFIPSFIIFSKISTKYVNEKNLALLFFWIYFSYIIFLSLLNGILDRNLYNVPLSFSKKIILFLIAFFIAGVIVLFFRYLSKRIISFKQRTAYLLIFLAAVFALLAIKVGENRKSDYNFDKTKITCLAGGKVLLIGIDGASLDILIPMVYNGRLPNIKNLIKEGSYGILRSEDLMLSHPIWTTIVTGKSRTQHGILGFCVFKWPFMDNCIRLLPSYNYMNTRLFERFQRHGFGGSPPYLSSMRYCKALWNILTDCGKRSGIVDFRATYPAEKVNGFIVSDHYVRLIGKISGKSYDIISAAVSLSRLPLDENIVYPASILPTIPKIIRTDFSLDYFGKVNFDDLEEGVKSLYITDQLNADIAKSFFKQFDTDFSAVYFDSIDAACHKYWPYTYPWGTREKQHTKFHNIVERIYEFTDKLIGEVLENIGKDATVIIVSDHGYGSITEKSHWHKKEGVFIIKGPNILNKGWIQENSIYDITPTILYLMGLPIARDMKGKVILGVFDEEYRKNRPLRFINTYEAKDKIISHSIKPRPEFEDLHRQRLKALGYIN